MAYFSVHVPDHGETNEALIHRMNELKDSGNLSLVVRKALAAYLLGESSELDTLVAKLVELVQNQTEVLADMQRRLNKIERLGVQVAGDDSGDGADGVSDEVKAKFKQIGKGLI